jgi:hypothetical protein
MVVDTPLYVADEIARRNLQGKIAAPMDWSDYLIWKTNSGLRPLVYSHVHLTERETWQDYESIFRGNELWLNVLQNHEMKYLLISRSRYPQLARIATRESLGPNPRLSLIYQDQRCVLAELHLSKQQPAKATTLPAAATPAGEPTAPVSGG